MTEPTGTSPEVTSDEADAVAARRGARRGRGRTPAATETVPPATPVAADEAAAAAVQEITEPAADTSPEAVERAAVAEVAASMPVPPAPVPAAPTGGDGTVAASLPAVQRESFAVLDPAGMVSAVASTSPYAATSGNRDGYVRAPHDATELLYPEGCTTPLTRKAWGRGDWVRAEVYAAWARQQPEGVDTTPLPPEPHQGHDELVRGTMDVNAGSFTAPVSF